MTLPSAFPVEWLLSALVGLVIGFALAVLFFTVARRGNREAFRALSSEALQANNALFLDLAKNVLARQQDAATGDLARKNDAVAAMLKPFQDTLTRLDAQNRELEKARADAYGALRQQLAGLVDTQQQLRAETVQLKQALRRPEGRGRWGEMQLRRVLEMAGMVEHCDFIEQVHQGTEEGTRRPDVIVNLPGARQLVIDCKTPLDALLDMADATDAEAEATQRQRHARKLRDHVKGLSTKAYWQQFDQAPDFVLLFVPGEHMLSLALQQDPELFDFAFSNRVILTTPMNLVGVMKAIAHTWRQQHLADDARRIAKLGKEIYEAMASVAVPFESLGEALRKSVDHYNRAAGAFEGKLLGKARRLKEEYDIESDKIIEAASVLEVAPRPLTAFDNPLPDAPEKSRDVA